MAVGYAATGKAVGGPQPPGRSGETVAVTVVPWRGTGGTWGARSAAGKAVGDPLPPGRSGGTVDSTVSAVAETGAGTESICVS